MIGNSRDGTVGRYVDHSPDNRNYRLAANADICHFSSTDRNEDTFHDASVDVRMVLYCLVLFHRSGDVTLLFTKDIILL